VFKSSQYNHVASRQGDGRKTRTGLLLGVAALLLGALVIALAPHARAPGAPYAPAPGGEPAARDRDAR
jgi:hypothetical protein